MVNVLYEDNHCIAVYKHHGVLAQADDEGIDSLFEQVKDFIKRRDNKPGNVFLGLVHRLDRPVGGVMVYAKTSKGASRLSASMRDHAIKKEYIAVVEGSPKKQSGSVEHWLLKDHDKNTVSAVRECTPGAKLANLDYHVIKKVKQGTLVEIIPHTGRPHQIRVAMKSLGCPIVGDTKYGAKQSLGKNIALFARSMTFPHPTLKKKITVKAEPELDVFENRK
ncbi:MAG: RluA family pseudouridine synthase, partial [Patescibacteria group bacterium]